MWAWLITVFVVCSPFASAEDGGWKKYAEKGGVTSYSQEIEGSRVLAMRGIAEIDLHISVVMGLYLDARNGPDWVDLLVRLDEHKLQGDDAIERHIYDMSWPTSDREFVFKREVKWEPEKKTVTVSYRSVDDDRYPVVDDYVRAIDHGSFWAFTALPGGKTRVEAVAKVDPQGSIPKWLFNMV